MSSPDSAIRGWITQWILASAQRPVFTIVWVTALFIAGLVSMRHTPMDAIPDLSQTQVVVLTEWPGNSPDRVEDQVTYPLTTALLGTPGVAHVRGQSSFGLSFVYVIFDEGTDLYWGRSRIVEQLVGLQGRLPRDARPTLGPEATGVGWVYQYALIDRAGQTDISELKAIQDWHLRFALESVPGVAEVAPVGGSERTYEVLVDPERLAATGVSLPQVVAAVQASNVDAGGRSLEIAGHEHIIRGQGRLRDLKDLKRVVLQATTAGEPIVLTDVAEVQLGPGSRRGIAELDGEGEVVGGIVVMRHGEDALTTIDAVKQRIEELKPGLPEGVEVIETYDRSDLIRGSVRTLAWTLAEEALIVCLVVFVFLARWRSAWVVVLTLPIAVAWAFIPLNAQGVTANIMSLGGIAIALGALVDGAIIVVENIERRLRVDPPHTDAERRERIITSIQEVGPSIFFSLLVITVGFFPVFALQATEGRLFHPLAWTKTWSMVSGAILAVTLTPALAVLLMKRHDAKREVRINQWLVDHYTPVVRWSIRNRRAVLAGASVSLLVSIPLFFSLDREFMPPLREGSLLYMPTSPPGMSITEAGNVLQVSDRALLEIPEVEHAFGKIGRAESATDPAPLSMIETTITLKDPSEWRPGLTWEGLIEELDATLQIPGMPNLWWMPIQTRIEMLNSGVRTPLALQIYADDPQTIQQAALSVESALSNIEGIRSIFAERGTGGLYIDIDIDRQRAAAWGVRSSDIQHAIETAVGGRTIAEIEDGRARFPVRVRYAREVRDDPDELGDVWVQAESGAQLPLSEVTQIRHTTGPPMLRTEAGKLVGFVFVDPGELALASFVSHANRILGDVPLPNGVRTEWVGQFEHMERAANTLLWVVPLTLFLVGLLLFLNTGSAGEVAFIMLAVPFSLVGALGLLWCLNYSVSVAVWVGLIALAGIDAEMGVIMLLYLKLAWNRRVPPGEAPSTAILEDIVVEGAAHRIRPKLMTVLCLLVGLLPLFFNSGPGSDLMRRLAAPLVGGLTSSLAMEILVYPAAYYTWKLRYCGNPLR